MMPVEIQPRIPNRALPDADWADTYQFKTARVFQNAREIAQSTIGRAPQWLQGLMAVRDAVVHPFGLKKASDLEHQASDAVGWFPVIEENDNSIVLGADDRHLDFRIVIEFEKLLGQTIIYATTLVKRKNAFGKLYLSSVIPFHKMIVPAMMKRAEFHSPKS